MTAARLVLTALVLGASTVAVAAPPPDVIFKDGFDPSTCGNATIDAGEDCDGPNLGGQSCPSLGYLSGTLACTPSCEFDTSSCSNCGNDVQDEGEDCDGNDLGGQDCVDFGFLTGFLACTDSCTFDFDGCSNCGNGEIDPGEVCDGPNLGGQTCQSQGFSGGTLACQPGCSAFDTSNCLP